MSLLVQIKLAQLVTILTCEPFSKEHIKKVLATGDFTLLDCLNDFHVILIPIFLHSLQVLANLVILIEGNMNILFSI